jgi:hypothetical protein
VAVDSNVATPTVHLHYYLGVVTTHYPPDEWFEYLRGPVGDARWAGIELDCQSNPVGGVLAFQQSLRDPGSVVIYCGHSALDTPRQFSLGLTPSAPLPYAEIADMERWEKLDKNRVLPGGKKPPPPKGDLMFLLKTSPARVVILASCGSATIPWGLSLTNFSAAGAAAWRGKVTGGPAVIVTKSQVLTTKSYNWAYALAGFLFDLIDYDVDWPGQPVPRKNPRGGTIQSALNAANAGFVKAKASDAFVLVKGDGSQDVFPGYRSAAVDDWSALDFDLDDDPQP